MAKNVRIDKIRMTKWREHVNDNNDNNDNNDKGRVTTRDELKRPNDSKERQ